MPLHYRCNGSLGTYQLVQICVPVLYSYMCPPSLCVLTCSCMSGARDSIWLVVFFYSLIKRILQCLVRCMSNGGQSYFRYGATSTTVRSLVRALRSTFLDTIPASLPRFHPRTFSTMACKSRFRVGFLKPTRQGRLRGRSTARRPPGHI